MPIGNITQTISTIPPAGARGVDVQTIFVTKQEDFQDHLQGTTVTELNTLKDQLNSRIGEINSTATTMNGYADTASAGASTATTKAGEASTSASGALTSRNQASTFATNSSNSATKASQWADNNYNVEVEAGKYSAKHWSVVAENATSGKIDKVTSTDNAIVRFNGTTGAVQNSGVIIDDGGNIGSGTQSFNGFGGSGFKNYIINGRFNIWQDGENLVFNASTSNYAADMWIISQLGVGGTQTVSKVAQYVNGRNIDTISSFQTKACVNRLIQILDAKNTSTLRGKKITVSFRYRLKGTLNVVLNQRTTSQVSSSEFSTSAAENIGTVIGTTSALIADETWRYASFTTSITDVNGFFHLVFIQNSTTGNYFELAEVQLEEGSIASPFEGRPYSLEFSLCSIYYTKLQLLEHYRAVALTAIDIYFFIPNTTGIIPTTVYLGVEAVEWLIMSLDITPVVGFSLAGADMNNRGLLFKFSKSGHGLTDAVLKLTSGVGYLSARL